MQRTLISGACGFVGHHVVEHLLKHTDWEIIVLDSLTYSSGGYDRLRDIEAFTAARVRILNADLKDPLADGIAQEIGQVDHIIHMAAESHVDRSIIDARPFVLSNVLGTVTMLDFARTQKELKSFIYFGTDEVFGPAPVGVYYGEDSRYDSSNPYAASKAGGEEMAVAYRNTHGVPVVITHTMNVFGERQHPEKFIPMCVKKILRDEKITLHASQDLSTPASRCWIHGRNVGDGLLCLMRNYESAVGQKWNLVGEEMNVLEVADVIAHTLNRDAKVEMVDFHSSRPGHDMRYALSGEKMKARYGWKPPIHLTESLQRVVRWMVKPENARWLFLGKK
jgi:dTDP-glucose 4,6-dehydratase